MPDGDTGTNLHLTLVAAVEALTESSLRGGDTETPTPRRLMSALAHGALMGARGNSGVILAQLLRGVADGLEGVERALDAGQLARALTAGARAAYEAVADPVEGTMLTVAREAAEAAEEVAAGRAGDATTTRRWPPWSPRPPRAPGPRWPGPPSSSRCCAGPASSTPAAAASACCSTRWPRSSPATTPRRPRCGCHARRPARRAPGRAAGWTSRTRTRTGRRTR